jgi:hypothetical protein
MLPYHEQLGGGDREGESPLIPQRTHKEDGQDLSRKGGTSYMHDVRPAKSTEVDERSHFACWLLLEIREFEPFGVDHD